MLDRHMPRPTRSTGMVVLAALVVLASCAKPGAPPAAAPGTLSAPPPLSARPDFEGWMLAPDGPAGGDARTAPDGRRFFILRGTRWVDHPDGSSERSRQVFQEDDVKA